MADLKEEPETSVAAKRAAFTATVYGIVPEGGSNAIGVSGILAHFPPRVRPIRSTVRSALLRLTRAGLVIETRVSSSKCSKIHFHRDEALTETELVARLWPPRPPRPKSSTGNTGKMAPQVKMRISPWRRDRLGNLWRTVTGVDAPAEVIAPMQAAGRAGGLATARGRARKANVVEAEMEAA
jgi:hypothetical protein